MAQSDTARAMVITEAGGELVLEQRELPTPGPGQVLVRVRACGVCHTDMVPKGGGFPGYPEIAYPLVPGHEIAGEILALGPGAGGWSIGQRVGAGWFGGACGDCDACRRGQLIDCADMEAPGITIDGGYADYALLRAGALAALPDELSFEHAAPMLCAGVTTYNALRHSGARAGERVAVLGLGGLGHLGVQFAAKMGFEVVAVARGAHKAELAKRLGAHHYVDSASSDPAAALADLGGVDVILSTVTASELVSRVFTSLRPRGRAIVLGVSAEPIVVSPMALISGSRAIQGHASGTASDSQDTLRFAALTGVRPLVETFPLEEANEAFDRMASGNAQGRVVITTAGETQR